MGVIARVRTETAVSSVPDDTATCKLDALIARGVQRGVRPVDAADNWQLSLFSGRLGEVSGGHAGAALTIAFGLVHEAQQKEEPVVWITGPASTFYPPDAAEAGVDLGALPVVRAPEVIRAARAADHLLRSGAFGLVVLDLGHGDRLPIPMQARLVGLSKRHDAALLCLTWKEARRPSIGSLVSLRVDARRVPGKEENVTCRVQALKDKRRGPGWTHTEVCRAPDGLC